MRVASVHTPSLLECRDIVAQRPQAYGAFDGCPPGGRDAILSQSCVATWHLATGEKGRVLYLTHRGSPIHGGRSRAMLTAMTRLCAEVIAAVQGYLVMWRVRFWQDG
jgi:hypothetical protein